VKTQFGGNSVYMTRQTQQTPEKKRQTTLCALTFESPADHQPKDENQSQDAATHHQLKPQVLKPHLSPQLSAMPVEAVSLKQVKEKNFSVNVEC
jgi:hypothetical protein